jgi:hypothetical protein
VVPRFPWLAFAAVAAVPSFAPGAAPQGGWDKRAYPDLGITLPEPRDYDPIPTQPDEEYVVLQYVEELPKDPKLRGPTRPELAVVWIDWVPEPPPRTEEPAGPPPAPDSDDGGRTKAEPKARAPEPPPKPPIDGIERWLEQRTAWLLGRGEPGKPREGWTSTLHVLAPKPNVSGLAGWCYVYEQPRKRTVAFVGTCGPDQLEDQAKIWKHMAERAELYEPEAVDVAKLERDYASKRLRGSEYRIGVRSRMVRGWKAEDTSSSTTPGTSPWCGSSAPTSSRSARST